MKHKKGPVICSHCRRELTDYKEIATDIRLKAEMLAAVEAGDSVIYIARANHPRSGEYGVQLSLSPRELNNVASAPSRRQVLNIARYPCPNPECAGRFYEWERLV